MDDTQAIEAITAEMTLTRSERVHRSAAFRSIARVAQNAPTFMHAVASTIAWYMAT